MKELGGLIEHMRYLFYTWLYIDCRSLYGAELGSNVVVYDLYSTLGRTSICRRLDMKELGGYLRHAISILHLVVHRYADAG